MSRKISCLLIFTLTTLSGCTATHENLNGQAPGALTQIMAQDSARQLAALYPPARTRLELKQSSKDAFGRSLVDSLRQKGYSLAEAGTNGPHSTPKTSSELPLQYVMDNPIKNSLYRVSIRVGGQSISRAYILKKGQLTPAGFWVNQEGVA